MSTRLETARLVLRTFEPEDGQAWLAMVNEPDFNRYLPPGPDATMENFLRSVERRHTLEREHGYAVWAVDLKESASFVGQCGFIPAEGKGPEIELVYHFGKAAWNKGYATEAATAALAHGFGPIALERVIAYVMPANIGSCRVAEKAGMRLEGSAGSATAYDIPGINKYVAERAWWRQPAKTETSIITVDKAS